MELGRDSDTGGQVLNHLLIDFFVKLKLYVVLHVSPLAFSTFHQSEGSYQWMIR